MLKPSEIGHIKSLVSYNLSNAEILELGQQMSADDGFLKIIASGLELLEKTARHQFSDIFLNAYLSVVLQIAFYAYALGCQGSKQED